MSGVERLVKCQKMRNYSTKGGATFLYWILGTGSLEKRLRWQGKQVQQDVNIRQTTGTWEGNQQEQYEGID